MTTFDATAEEARIRALLEERAAAIRARDIAGGVARLAPDVVSFDVVNPLQQAGAEAVRGRLEAWVASFAGPIGFEMAEVRVVCGDGVAFCHCLNHVSATTGDGTALDMWWRATLGLENVDGAWTITHEHASVPFDPETGNASVDLKP